MMRASEFFLKNSFAVQSELSKRATKLILVSAYFSFLGYGPHALLLIGTVPDRILLAWFAVAVTGAVILGVIGAKLRHAHDQSARRDKLLRALMVDLLLWGGVWGSMVLLPGVTASPIMLALTLVCVAGTAVAAVHPLHYHSSILAAFTAGMLAPAALLPVLEHDVPMALSVIALCFWGMCQAYGWMTRKIVLGAIIAEQGLRIAKEEAEAANRAKSVFLSNMSHELRTPLNAILGYVQLLSGQANLTEPQRQQIGVMGASGYHLLTLIGDILDLSRIEAEKMELAVTSFRLRQLLDEVVEIIRPGANRKGLDLRFELDSPLPELMLGDEARLRQILLNLLTNAVKFTPAGSVTLRASYDADGGRLCCEVADTGIGIPEDKLDAIFEPFAQLTPDALGREGVGLGLAITHRLTSLMGGEVTVTSRVGVGSSFRWCVPLPVTVAGERAGEAVRERICGYVGPRRRILAVDDTPANAALLVDMLTPIGFDVQTAADGREAIAAMLASPPDLVLLDMIMPGMDGVEAAREMRRHDGLANVPIVGLSATLTDSELKQAFVAACDVFIGKPIRVEELLQNIGRLLGLEWQTAASDPMRLTAEPMIPPPHDEVSALHKLALMGNMRDILQYAGRIEELDPSYRQFAAHLRQLAKGFQSKAILELAEKHLK